MSEDIRFYRGLHKVKIVTKSDSYWIVEAQEDFEDYVDEKRTPVKIGEQRIVSPALLFKEMKLPPPIRGHAYELEMEKKLKRVVARASKSNNNPKDSFQG